MWKVHADTSENNTPSENETQITGTIGARLANRIGPEFSTDSRVKATQFGRLEISTEDDRPTTMSKVNDKHVSNEDSSLADADETPSATAEVTLPSRSHVSRQCSFQALYLCCISLL